MVRILLLIAILVCSGKWLAAFASDIQPGESVEYVTESGLLGQNRLETTVYRPTTKPPWPLVVLNHGNNPGPDKHMQSRWRPDWVADFFVRQGYMVIVPMRLGYAGSSGTFEYNCDPVAFGDRAADEVEAAIRYFVKRNEVKPKQVLVIGQSQGGWVTLAYAAKYNGARAVVNMDGGIAAPNPSCPAGWQKQLIAAGRVIGAKAKSPSLWMYANDDPYFPPLIVSSLFEAYRGAGADARLKTVPNGGHAFMWGPHFNEEQWRTTVEKFISDSGLPTGPPANQKNNY